MTSFIEDIDEQNDLINEANNAPKVSSNAFECSKRQKNMTWKKRLLQLYQQCQGSSSNHDNRGLGMGAMTCFQKLLWWIGTCFQMLTLTIVSLRTDRFIDWDGYSKHH